jgi:hypothetical protein
MNNDVKCSKDETNSKSFQEFSNTVKNLSAIVENLGRNITHLWKQLVQILPIKMLELLRIQWGSYWIQHNVERQNIDFFAYWIASLDKNVGAAKIGSHIP